MKLIPEKTVEQWFAVSLADFFGPDIWLWADAAGWDQHAWVGGADILSKWMLFELKAPEDNLSTLIDVRQLEKYVAGFESGAHPDVVYLLPDPLWRSTPRSGDHLNHRAAPWNRRSFASWTFCLRASDLLDLIRRRKPSGRLPATATIRCHTGRVTYQTGEAGCSLLLLACGLRGFGDAPSLRALPGGHRCSVDEGPASTGTGC